MSKIKKIIDAAGNADKKKVVSVKTKLLSFISAVIIFSVVVSLTVSIYSFINYTEDQGKRQAVTGMEELNDIIENFNKNAKGYANIFASHPGVIKAVTDRDYESLIRELKPLVAQTDVDFVTVTDGNGLVFARTHDESKRGDSVTNQANVKMALIGECKGVIETGTVVKLSARAGAPVKDSAGKIVGVISLGYDLSKESIVDVIKKRLNIDATLFLGDVRINTTIIQDGKRLTGTKLDPFIADKVLKQSQIYEGRTDILGIPYITAYMPIMNLDNKPIGIIFAGKPMADVKNVRYNIIFHTSWISLLIVLAIIVFAYLWINKRIVKPIKLIEHILGCVSNGELNVKIDETRIGRDEIGLLVLSLKKMLGDLSSIVSSVKQNSQRIDESSQSLAASAEEMASSSDNVALTIQDVAKGTGSQAEELVEIIDTLNRFGEQLGNIVQAINDVDANSRSINLMADKSNISMKSLMDSVNMVNDSFSSFISKITGFGASIKNIDEITNLINNIADQTNLLALNASIEAARAGEAGKGFAVVANEIRTLAEQAKSSSYNINALINSISGETGDMIKTGSLMNRELKNQALAINTSIESFRNIIKAIDEVIPKIEAVNSSASSIDAEKNIILEKIEGVSAVAEEISASSQEIAAASEEMSASTQEVASTVQQLSSMAKNMMEQVNKFKL